MCHQATHYVPHLHRFLPTMVIGQVIARSCFPPAAQPGQERRTNRGSACPALRCRSLPSRLFRGDAPDLAPPELDEPDVARVGGPGRDAERLAAEKVTTGRWQAERGDEALGGDAPDAIPKG